MVPDKFNMVDMGGVDLIMMQGEEVPGLYNRLVESIAQCRYQCLYNWLFDGVIIPPTYVEMEVNENDEVIINEGVAVTEDDVIHIYSVEPPAPEPVINPISITENGTYTAPAGVDGFNPVTVDIPSVISPISITANGVYTPPSGVDGYAPVTVSVAGVSSITIIDYDLMKTLYDQSIPSKDYGRLFSLVGGGQSSNANGYVTWNNDNGNRYAFYRSGMYNYGYTFLQKIPASAGMTKMYIRIKTESPSTYKRVNVQLGRTPEINSSGYPVSSIKEVLSLNAGVNWTTYEIDISDVQEDFYVNISNCDLAFYVNSLYFE